MPTALERLIVWAMTKKREDRLPSLEHFVKELEPFADEVSYRESVTRHAASLPNAAGMGAALKTPSQVGAVSAHAATVAGRVGEATGAAAAEALQGRLFVDDGGNPITVPVRRQPIALYAGIGVLLLGGAAAWGLSGGASDSNKAPNVVKPRPEPEREPEPETGTGTGNRNRDRDRDRNRDRDRDRDRNRNRDRNRSRGRRTGPGLPPVPRQSRRRARGPRVPSRTREPRRCPSARPFRPSQRRRLHSRRPSQ